MLPIPTSAFGLKFHQAGCHVATGSNLKSSMATECSARGHIEKMLAFARFIGAARWLDKTVELCLVSVPR